MGCQRSTFIGAAIAIGFLTVPAKAFEYEGVKPQSNVPMQLAQAQSQGMSDEDLLNGFVNGTLPFMKGNGPALPPDQGGGLDPELSAQFEEAGRINNVDPTLLQAIAMVKGSGIGLMNIMPSAAKRYHIANPSDPVQAIYGAARILNDAITKGEALKASGREINPVEYALETYVGGPNEAKWGPTTRAYPSYIAGQYQQLRGGAPNSSAASASRESPTAQATRSAILSATVAACHEQALSESKLIGLMSFDGLSIADVCECQASLFISKLDDGWVRHIAHEGYWSPIAAEKLGPSFVHSLHFCATNLGVERFQRRVRAVGAWESKDFSDGCVL